MEILSGEGFGQMTLWEDIYVVVGILGGALFLVGALALWIARLRPEDTFVEPDLVVMPEVPLAD
ncbi:hypothetical protein Afil01_24100 [Actinorhabdospora filicis]|uniref:Uncharacterized protein n=2 Tax=Actinorhabdospora filicis TaxID=1785913 RepID=A0A9W6W934_9ACTN|nr:hypothetical protein Afil01_24100 [Actinorhabdospora filicis]